MPFANEDVAACKRPGCLRLRRVARSILQSADFEEALQRLDVSPERLISPLLSLLFETDESIRWRGVRAVAITIAAMAGTSLESARDIMRRLIWSLNDESGGIGWGAPEAMGEAMAESEILAREYYRILISYIDENGNLLENDQLERGVLWGIARLAQARPELVQECIEPVIRQLSSSDAGKRALALRALGFLRPAPESVTGPLSFLLQDESEVRIYEEGEMRVYRVCELASELLAKIKASE
ncbi:MAG: DVU0298 family protein [Syntrophobacteraceae bacterium]